MQVPIRPTDKRAIILRVASVVYSETRVSLDHRLAVHIIAYVGKHCSVADRISGHLNAIQRESKLIEGEVHIPRSVACVVVNQTSDLLGRNAVGSEVNSACDVCTYGHQKQREVRHES